MVDESPQPRAGPPRRASKKRRSKKAPPRRPSRPVVRAGDLERQVRRARHRVAILEALSRELMGMFIGGGGSKAKYAIAGTASVELADAAVVEQVEEELMKMAEAAKLRVTELLALEVSDAEPEVEPSEGDRTFAAPTSPERPISNPGGVKQEVLPE